jgi:SpoU rRNA methylase family enzyme
LGALKSLTGADRTKVKQTAAEKGVAEAVKLALSMKKA